MTDTPRLVLFCNDCNHRVVFTGDEFKAKIKKPLLNISQITKEALIEILKKFRCSKCKAKNFDLTIQGANEAIKRAEDKAGSKARSKVDKPYGNRYSMRPTHQSFTYTHEENETSRKKTPRSTDPNDIIRVCTDCGKSIPLKRIQAMPNARLCVSCQENREQGKGKEEEKVYCKRCGAEMVWRQRTSVLPTKYFLGCSNYPKCRYVIAGSW